MNPMSSQLNMSVQSKSTLFLVLGICLCLYFSFHLLFGERGYLKYVSLSHQYELSQIEYNKLRAEREALEAKVVGMRSGSIDVDLLEERVQFMLGVLPENAFILKH